MPDLPQVLPIFPLTGVLLLPGMVLPLHIFEPRYCNMVSDALEGGGHIGMIQPMVPRQDNRPLPGAEQEQPELYPVGCAGALEHSEQSADGRYLIHLRGVSRFRVEKELPPLRGYRRVEARYDGFPEDGPPPRADLDTTELLEAFQDFGGRQGMEINLEEAARLPGVLLLNQLAVSLPFAPSEKQALLEAPGLNDRLETLISLLRLGEAMDGDTVPAPPDLN